MSILSKSLIQKMKNKVFIALIIINFSLLIINSVSAGNPDRQGQAGAYELLLNPWARTVGVHLTNTAYVSGVEAMNLNIAGLGRTKGMELGIGHSILYQGSGLGVNAAGFAQKVGNGVFGVSLNALNFGKIPVTTTAQPEGTGATYSPTFFNVCLGYAYQFEEKISVGIGVRFINESLADISASGFSLDAGVQYATGDDTYKKRFQFGVALRNIGSPMHFTGQGLSDEAKVTNVASPYVIRVARNAANFELPSQLLIGASYDIIPMEKSKLTASANFTSNAFSRDEIGAALIFSMNEVFVLRAAYRYEVGLSSSDLNHSVYTGPSMGFSVNVPTAKNSDRTFSIDYGYLFSNPWGGTHNIGVRLSL